MSNDGDDKTDQEKEEPKKPLPPFDEYEVTNESWDPKKDLENMEDKSRKE